jgi:hypothetical protein
MAFSFHGTFSKSQFDRFAIYVREQVQLIDARIEHLTAELNRVGDLAFAYDSGGIPTGFANDPPLTYCGKLFGAYEALGGDVEFDLQVRSTNQPVFQLAGDETQAAQLMSNGEVIPVLGLSDAESSILMQKLRSWVADDLQYRREALERKMRRAIDYAEQLKAEISELKTIKESVTTDGSMEFLINSVNSLSADRRYMAITNDEGTPDPHGKFAKAPVAAYMPGGGGKGATATTYERTLDGLVKPEK